MRRLESNRTIGLFSPPSQVFIRESRPVNFGQIELTLGLALMFSSLLRKIRLKVLVSLYYLASLWYGLVQGW